LAQYEERPYRNRLVQFLLDDPEPLLHGEEPILLDGGAVGYVRSGAYGHTLGGAMGFGYVAHADGVTAELVDGGAFEVVVAGERVAARASLRSMYDPRNERVRT
jgi:glycine cleavage system aminomethyltransferase T